MNAIAEIRKLLPTQYHWIKDSYATDCDNNIVEVHDYKACKFCLGGSINRVFASAYSEFSQAHRANFIKRISQIILTHFGHRVTHPQEYSSVPEFNDHPDTTFQDIQFILNEMEKSNGNPTLST